MSDITHESGVQRRDFLYVTAGALGGVGTLVACWPFIDQMNPSSDALAAGGPMAVDLASVAPGQQIIVRWRSMPIFIVHRTPAMLATLKEPQLLSMLRDPGSEENQQPAYALNWSRSLKPEYLILVGICTHLGCIPTFSPLAGSLLPSAPAAGCAIATAPNTTWPGVCSRACPRPTTCRCRPTTSAIPPR